MESISQFLIPFMSKSVNIETQSDDDGSDAEHDQSVREMSVTRDEIITDVENQHLDQGAH